jgi:hypothetical protein
MKTKYIVVVCIVVLIAVAGIFAVSRWRLDSEWNKAVEALQGLPPGRIITAVQAFTHDRQAGHGSFPKEVSLDELVSGGYLKMDEIAAFRGREVKIFTAVDSSTLDILLLAHLTGTHYLAEMTDGSMMRLTQE